MIDISKLLKKSFLHLTPYHHGGNVWDFSERYDIPLNQVIDFSISTNPFGAPNTAFEAILGHLELIKHYPDPDPKWLLQSLAESVGVNQNNIILGNGSTELIYLFNEVLLENGFSALIPIPSFSEYKAAIERFRGNITFFECDPKITDTWVYIEHTDGCVPEMSLESDRDTIAPNGSTSVTAEITYAKNPLPDQQVTSSGNALLSVAPPFSTTGQDGKSRLTATAGPNEGVGMVYADSIVSYEPVTVNINGQPEPGTPRQKTLLASTRICRHG